MKILVVSPEYSGFGGGIMTFYQNLVPALKEVGCSVHVVEGSAWNHQRTCHSLDSDCSSIKLTTDDFMESFGYLGHLAAVPTLRRYFAGARSAWLTANKFGPFDIIEATDFGFNAVYPQIEGCTVVQQMHASVGQIALHDPQDGESADVALAHAVESELVRAISTQTYSEANARYWRIATGAAVNVIRPAWTPAHDTGAKSPLSSRISVFGRIQRWKGPHVLCEAIRILGPKTPRTDWYGRDTPSGEHGISTSEWLANSFPDVWGTHIAPHPPIAPSRVRSIQASSLVNLVPSTWDVFNFTAVEALASGRPTVCSDGAGAHELIENGVTGYVYKANDPHSLADVLDQALSLSECAIRAMGEAARATLALNLDPTKIAEERLRAYRQAASEQIKQPLPGWMQELVGHQQLGTSKAALSFLNRIPLRDLVQYCGKRALDRLRRRMF